MRCTYAVHDIALLHSCEKQVVTSDCDSPGRDLAMQCLRQPRGCASQCRPAAPSRPCVRMTCRAAAAGNLYEPKAYTVVSDAMTSGTVISCKPEDTVDSALELLVQHRISGLPVVNDANTVVGVVSDYDLLALDKLGAVKDDRQLFPQADQTWQAFNEVKALLAKSSGKKVKDVMTATPITVKSDVSLDDAARMLLSKKIHRLPVVDGTGQLVGVLSRGNIVKAALAMRKQS